MNNGGQLGTTPGGVCPGSGMRRSGRPCQQQPMPWSPGEPWVGERGFMDEQPSVLGTVPGSGRQPQAGDHPTSRRQPEDDPGVRPNPHGARSGRYSWRVAERRNNGWDPMADHAGRVERANKAWMAKRLWVPPRAVNSALGRENC